MTNKKPAYWNGKNFSGETQVGANELISESPQTSPTQSNYQVTNDTISADDLQASAQSSKELTKTGG